MLSLLSVVFFKRGETWADLKCEGKEPSESDRLTIDRNIVKAEVNQRIDQYKNLAILGSDLNLIYYSQWIGIAVFEIRIQNWKPNCPKPKLWAEV